MPPKIRITGTEIINIAISIVREQGIEAVNARSIASRLNCSVRPLFREFSSMDILKSAVIKKASEIYTQKMKEAFESSQGFYAMGIAYTNFAKTEPNLFRLLFMTNLLKNKNAVHIAGTTTGDNEVITSICNQTGLKESNAQELYTGIWLTTHGIASLFATNSCTLNDDEISKILKNCFEGLVYTLQSKQLANTFNGNHSNGKN